METLIVLCIVFAAVALLVRRFMKRGPVSGCGCACRSCSPGAVRAQCGTAEGKKKDPPAMTA